MRADAERIVAAFAGFLLFLDSPKAGVAETLTALAGRGIRVKVVRPRPRQWTARRCQAALTRWASNRNFAGLLDALHRDFRVDVAHPLDTAEMLDL